MTGPRVEARFAHYLYGKAPGWALRADQRFSYYTYVPPRLAGQSGPVPIVLVVHGTLRQPTVYRDAFAEFAEEHGCVVLAPLFPCGIVDPDDVDNYKRLEFHGIRFDLLLIRMVEEFAGRYGIEPGPLLLHGFSGGAQFAHRFLLLHAERLAAVSIGAPGAVTLLDEQRDWWVGTRDIAGRFGKAVDPAALRRVRVLTVIGEQDHGGEEVWVPETSRHWMPEANRAGADRQERLLALERNLTSHGVDVERGVVPGAGHKGSAMLPAVREFFARILTEGMSE
ncbi:hypothetical protein [Sciscionella marina]|uniref:hypothetical protein n=1 Tax=Sciscionella marina TaxID=508770 RepID=UPI00036DD010|nr:hypothetical protein [Sciscionella marina]